ncbi:hypothetical protein [Gordonia sp. HS-NH1]|uniref:hypothetical protein n=1 Tax=Gordonia sp. HS-NH1 TaxID=1435068 RepID=UPI0006E310E4|nr:hypothetical protein [Gordonia sp. HS-NH1]
MRVSSLQTGHHAGEVGSTVGQHAHRDGLTVVTHRPSEILFAQRHGRFAVTMRAIRDPASSRTCRSAHSTAAEAIPAAAAASR